MMNKLITLTTSGLSAGYSKDKTMSAVNKMSIATIIAAIVNILVIIYMSTCMTSYISAILAWSVVVTTQLSLIAVRSANESK